MVSFYCDWNSVIAVPSNLFIFTVDDVSETDGGHNLDDDEQEGRESSCDEGSEREDDKSGIASEDEIGDDESHETPDNYAQDDYSSTNGNDSDAPHPSPCNDDLHRDEESFHESDVQYPPTPKSSSDYSPSEGECLVSSVFHLLLLSKLCAYTKCCNCAADDEDESKYSVSEMSYNFLSS